MFLGWGIKFGRWESSLPYLSAYIWPITPLCHEKDSLRRFAQDRLRWLQWLFEAKKGFGTRILGFTATSSLVHLTTKNDGGREGIPQTVQLASGRRGIDRVGYDYLRQMRHPSRYLVIEETAALPRELPKIYRRLTS